MGLMVEIPALFLASIALLCLSSHRDEFRAAAWVVGFIGPVGGLAVGIVSFFGGLLPYWAGWGDRSLDNIGGDAFNWPAWVIGFGFIIPMAGLIFGFVAGLAAAYLYTLFILLTGFISNLRSKRRNASPTSP